MVWKAQSQFWRKNLIQALDSKWEFSPVVVVVDFDVVVVSFDVVVVGFDDDDDDDVVVVVDVTGIFTEIDSTVRPVFRIWKLSESVNVKNTFENCGEVCKVVLLTCKMILTMKDDDDDVDLFVACVIIIITSEGCITESIFFCILKTAKLLARQYEFWRIRQTWMPKGNSCVYMYTTQYLQQNFL